MGVSESFNDAAPFEITDIDNGGTGETPSEITFEYPNPAISIDTGSNYVTHEIIGGAVVRQRTGDKPLDISVSGVCTEDTAGQLSLLRNADAATLLSNRFNGNSIRVHIASLSTDPLEDGGAADLKSGEFLYSFSLNCVEILNDSGSPVTSGGGGDGTFGGSTTAFEES